MTLPLDEARLPEIIHSETELDELLTRPSPELAASMRQMSSPLLILGAGGKMGPTLAMLARRAADAAGSALEIIAVSRFSDPASREWLEANEVATLSLNLLEKDAFARLPDCQNLVYLVGMKFGTQQRPELTWAANTLIPAWTMERFPETRVTALSTGNVYPLAPVAGPGSREDDPLTPLGEYANACVGRERIFGYYARMNSTPLVLLRLSYALDLRYGVLVDIAQKIAAGLPVDLSMAQINIIWQGDANAFILRSLALASVPSTVLNLVGSQHYRVQDIALRLGELMARPVIFTGIEGATAILSDNSRLRASLGEPPTSIETVLRWTAAWVASGGRLLGKPTHFEVKDGGY